MKKGAVILLGPPGSGKGTQANLLSNALGMVHFDTGRFLELFLHDPAQQKKAAIRKERRLFDSGKLNTPSVVLKIVKDQVKKISQAGVGVVFSGSPRTLYEARGLMPFLDKLYGKKNVHIFFLDVPADVSIRRNKKRLVCKVCGAPLLTEFYDCKNPKHCPLCGGPLYRRSLDKEHIIKDRLVEYANRTEPVIAFLKKKGYDLHRVSGESAPYKVFEKMRKILA